MARNENDAPQVNMQGGWPHWKTRSWYKTRRCSKLYCMFVGGRVPQAMRLVDVGGSSKVSEVEREVIICCYTRWAHIHQDACGQGAS